MTKSFFAKILYKASTCIEEANINADLTKHARDWNWGFYSSSLRELVKLCSKKDNPEQYLKVILESLIFEMSEPNNVGEAKNEPDILKQYPPFSRGKLDDDVVWGKIEACAKAMKLDEEALKNFFIGIHEELKSRVKLPYTAEQAWKQILRCKKLFEENK